MRTNWLHSPKTCTIQIKNKSPNYIQFAEIEHYTGKEGVWTKEDNVIYDPIHNEYVGQLSTSANHSFGPACSIKSNFSDSGGGGDIYRIDNLGNMNPKETLLTTGIVVGWEINIDLFRETLNKDFPYLGHSEAEIGWLMSAITKAIASIKGSPAGFHNIMVPWGKAVISGDTEMVFYINQKMNHSLITFNLIYNDKITPLNVYVWSREKNELFFNYNKGESHN